MPDGADVASEERRAAPSRRTSSAEPSTSNGAGESRTSVGRAGREQAAWRAAACGGVGDLQRGGDHQHGQAAGLDQVELRRTGLVAHGPGGQRQEAPVRAAFRAGRHAQPGGLDHHGLLPVLGLRHGGSSNENGSSQTAASGSACVTVRGSAPRVVASASTVTSAASRGTASQARLGRRGAAEARLTKTAGSRTQGGAGGDGDVGQVEQAVGGVDRDQPQAQVGRGDDRRGVTGRSAAGGRGPCAGPRSVSMTAAPSRS